MKKEALINILLTTTEPTEEKLKKLNENYQELSEEDKKHIQQQTLSYTYQVVKYNSPYQKGKINSSVKPVSQTMANNLSSIIELAAKEHLVLDYYPILHTATMLATKIELQQIDMVHMYANTKSFVLSLQDQIAMEMGKIDLEQQTETLHLEVAKAKSTQTMEIAANDYSEGKITLEEYLIIIQTEQTQQQYLGAEYELSQLIAKKEKTLLQYGALHVMSSRTPVMPEQELDQLNSIIDYQKKVVKLYQKKLASIQELLPEEAEQQTSASTLDTTFNLNLSQPIPSSTQKKYAI